MLVGKTSWIVTPIALLGMVSLRTFALADDVKPEDIYKSVVPSVVTLRVEKKQGGSLGTAFMAIKEGVAVTAWHVVKNAKSATAKFSNGEEFDVSGLIDKDEKRDIALIRVKVHGKPMLPMVSEDPPVGSKAYVIGSPRGLEFTISDGLISQIQTIGGRKQYQFSCPASPGNSGGPVVNARGSVLGTVSWGVEDGQNLNFAVPASYALGLDATLPTQPWDAVRSTEPPTGAGAPATGSVITNDEADKLIADALVCNADATLAMVFAELEIINKPLAYRNGVPPMLYSMQLLLESNTDRLSKVASTEANRSRVLEYLKLNMGLQGDIYARVIDAIKEAQRTGGWGASASDMVSKAQATFAAKRPSPADEESFEKALKELAKSVVLQDGLTKEGVDCYHLHSDYTFFSFGAGGWIRNPSTLVMVIEGTLADKLGFQIGDELVSIEGQQKATVANLKRSIYDKKGKSLIVVVRRDGKTKELNLSIPSELPIAKKY